MTNYQQHARRTMNPKLSRQEQISNMAMGIAGESGEIIDALKKYQFQGHMIDVDHLEEEIGDTLFYIANLATLFNIDLNNAMERNTKKLLKRYPNGFSEKESIERADKDA